ncbi:Short-chain dehydrogenase/reductase SDR [Dillenia turbinata]|uniref:Short-chain dehydrogenase/reductase SDR n=1 Tax=Dillenia turbinata TaxID=194707 RepID=A0AAN8ZES0_9MAGN
MVWPFSWKGPSGFSGSSTAEEVTQGVDGSDLTAIVTGASSGLGTETARVLALRGIHVVMAVRNVEAGQKTKQTILEQIPNAKIDVMELDLSSMASIRKFASEYSSLGLPLNILINNAGIMASPFQLSKDKIEMQFATNHIGHFLLTNLLLDKMKKTAFESKREGRIVNLSSVAHKFTYSGGIQFDKINDESSYSSMRAYGQSKLANILHANELSRRLKEEGVNITVNSVHPGAIGTNLFRYRGPLKVVALFLKCVAHTIEQGAATTCYVAMNPQVEGVSGKYLTACNIAKPASWAEDSELATNLKLHGLGGFGAWRKNHVACCENRDERDDAADDDSDGKLKRDPWLCGIQGDLITSGNDNQGNDIQSMSQVMAALTLPWKIQIWLGSSTAEEVTQGIDGSDLTAIVTGASSGLGTETARVLALRGVHVIMAVRNVEAGIMACPFMLSKDKIEMQFATNHMGHFLLTNLLLDNMIKTATESKREGRIVNLSSVAHKFTYSEGIQFDKINDKSSYSSMLAYGQSKLANILHANELSRRLKEEGVNVTANSVHPGAIATSLLRYSGPLKVLAVFLKYVTHTIEQGAATTCYVAMHPQVKGISGEYLAACNVVMPSSWAADSELAAKLWNFSMDFKKKKKKKKKKKEKEKNKLFPEKGPSGFSSSSTAEEVTQGIDASGLTAIVTGASSGIGTETARVLALRGAHVVMAVRNVDAGQKVKESILKETPTAKVDVMELDLSSVASVRKFASEYNSSGLPLHLLIFCLLLGSNNAGIMLCPFMLSQDKIELQFATNHIGHFLLTNLLLDTMKKTALESKKEGRIVNLSSMGHQLCYREGVRFDKINDKSSYNSLFAYGQSKLSNILHAKELTRRLKEEGVEITANALYPGAIGTNLTRYSSFLAVMANTVGKFVLQSIPQVILIFPHVQVVPGAATTCYVALNPQVKGVSGEYFSDSNIAKPSAMGNDAELAKKLWDFSMELTG